MIKMLIATPWIGEFGWELMRWQGYLRHLSKSYDTTVVLGAVDFYLYRDFAQRKITGIPDMETIRDTIIDYVHPSNTLCRGHIEQDFIKLGKPLRWSQKRIVIHARKDKREVLGDRNWPRERWDELVGLILNRFSDVSIYTIGTYESAMDLNGVTDIRGSNLEITADLLASSGLCLGPSSGSMHFASLCGCPQIVWTDTGTWRVGDVKATNRQRYETLWNPFKTPAYVIDNEGWQPSVEIVFRKIKEVYSK